MLFFYLMTIDDENERKTIEELYEKYKYHCLHMAAVQLENKQDAEDIVQDAFVRIIRHRKEYLKLSDDEFQKLLVVIIRNLVADYYRHKNRMYTDVFDFSIETVDDEFSVEDRVIMRVEAENVIEKMKKLDVSERSILCYKCIGMPAKTIADIMELSEKSVEVKLYRARRKLKGDMKGGELFE